MDNVGFLERTKLIGFSQTNTFGDVFFSNLNGSTFGKLSATTLFNAEYSKRLFDPTSLYVIVGTDSGLLPRYIEAEGIPEGSRYVFIEPSSVLKELEEEKVFEGFSEYFAFADETSWVDALTHFKVTDYFYIRAVSSYNAFCATEDAMGLYAELSWNVVDSLNQLSYKAMISLANQPFMIEQLYNLADNTSSSNALKNVFKGKAAFVLGGGPSLDDLLPWLVAHRAHFVIIAVSRIIKRLLECGLEPDFICSVDPGAVNWDVSKDIFSCSKKPVLLHAYHLYHELVSQWPGRAYYLGHRLYWESTLNEPTFTAVGPTVTNTAINIASEMGCSTIYLAGVDYCYTLDGFTHAQGSNESAAGARFNLTGVTVETYKGVMAPTGLDYLLAREGLIQQVNYLKRNSNLKLFNTASMAAVVEGVEYRPFSSIKLDKDLVDVEAVLGSLHKNEETAVFLRKVTRELTKVLHHFEEIKKIAQHAYNINEHLFNEAGLIEHFEDKLRMDKLEQQLKRKYRKLSRLVKSFGIAQFLRMTKPFSDLETMTAEEVKLSLSIYYQSYIDGASRLIQLVNNVMPIVRARTEEQKKHPDWDLLIDLCHKEKNYGRVRLWRDLPSAKELSQAHQKAFDELEALFIQALTKERVNHAENVKNFSNLGLLKSRAQILFNHKQKELLTHLLLAVDKHEDKEGVIPYRYLIQGYIAELDGAIDTAQEAYQQVIEYSEGPLEEALLRIFDINLQSSSDGELAHQALECLVQLNPRYDVFYAESCRIRGDVLEAIDVYINHISAYPNDIIAQLKLAHLYMEQKINEGARMMLNSILENNPKQEAALAMKAKLQEA
jgi:hypothetical protein